MICTTGVHDSELENSSCSFINSQKNKGKKHSFIAKKETNKKLVKEKPIKKTSIITKAEMPKKVSANNTEEAKQITNNKIKISKKPKKEKTDLKISAIMVEKKFNVATKQVHVFVKRKKLISFLAIKKIEDNIVTVNGKLAGGLGELVSFYNNFKPVGEGLIADICGNRSKIFILSGFKKINFFTRVYAAGPIQLCFSFNKILGSVVDPLFKFNNKQNNNYYQRAAINFAKNSGIASRKNVSHALITGTKIVDCLFPIGLGQRQLIIGDRCTGKTTLAVDTILAQRKTNIKCIYTAIGQKKSAIVKLVTILKKYEGLHYCTIVASYSSDAAALLYLTPFTACTLGEFYTKLGVDALIIYDDLSKHAVAYRQMALLLKKSPGREAYPSDIFYLHSGLLERAGQFLSGSLTALPIVETLQRDVSAFVPTNIISITDGQLFLDSNYYNKGIFPAINERLSVSRIGSKAQYPFMKNIAKWIKTRLHEYKRLAPLLSFSDDIDKETLDLIEFGFRLNEFLCQSQHKPLDIYDQCILFCFIFKGVLRFTSAKKTNHFLSFYYRWCNEFLFRQKYFNSYLNKELFDWKNKPYCLKYFSFGQEWYFSFGDDFFTSKGFIDFYCYVVALYIRLFFKKKLVLKGKIWLNPCRFMGSAYHN